MYLQWNESSKEQSKNGYKANKKIINRNIIEMAAWEELL